jgi:Holliday junction resolvasome RuvABC DNA-binding subunit
MKKIQDLKPVLHFKKDNYVYRYVLVDRFQNDSKNHYGFDTKEERTTYKAKVYYKEVVWHQ